MLIRCVCVAVQWLPEPGDVPPGYSRTMESKYHTTGTQHTAHSTQHTSCIQSAAASRRCNTMYHTHIICICIHSDVLLCVCHAQVVIRQQAQLDDLEQAIDHAWVYISAYLVFIMQLGE